ncbi:hypothetical protein [Clostridium sp. 'White wine YQ']|uniref:hypothetical protein n=1 Tax=Clostridium sp. 'White wine YQ' TaxID=3027474 RepID=UPI0023671EA3|nr:hypothetical protein [Clostridium sp. 'White wine YQ']MDD7794150.1 hypothetical protein [Clostridium sp. 'White wine YQ']
MKLKITSLLIVFVFCISFIGCTKSQSDKINGKQIGKPLENALSTPDKIIIYNNNTSKVLDKTNSDFKKIVDLTNSRFHNKLSTAKDIIDDTTMESIKKDGLGMEFIYYNEQDLSIKGDGFQPFNYHKLYFQLTSEKYGNEQGSSVHTLQYGDKDHYKDCSRGPLKYSEELVTTVENLKY